jgi:hypothetical protein
MNESFLQLRVNEIHCERLREAADRRLARQAREARAAAANDPAPGVGILGRLARSLGVPLSRPI